MPRLPLLAFALLACATSCKVGTDYHAPESDLPAGWLNKSPECTPLLLEAKWWKSFHDPVLDALIAKAASGNYDLKIAADRIREARAVTASAKADLLPTVNTIADGERQGNRIAFGNTPFNLAKPFNTFETGFDASWELDLFGGNRRKVEADNALLIAAIADAQNQRISLYAELAGTYIDLRRYQAQLNVAQATVQADEHTLSIASERYRTGNASNLDAIEAQSKLAEAQGQIPYYQSLIASTELALDVLFGEKPGAAHALTAVPSPLPDAPTDVILAAPSSVIATRPDIRAAERQLAAATAQRNVAVAQFFPDISLSGFFGLLNTSADQLLRANSKSWSVGGNVLWPILNYGHLSAGLHQADARQAEALDTYRKAVLVALADVERSVTSLQDETARQKTLAESAQRETRAVAIASDRYKAGVTSFTDVLEADRTLYLAQNRQIDSEAATLRDVIALYKSLGGAWNNNPPAQKQVK